MLLHVGSLSCEITRPESAKFRHPIVLLHGLWTGAWVWEGWASHLARRGWEVWAPTLRGDALEDHAARVTALEELARALPGAPVLVAHDTALVTAVAVAPQCDATVLVAIAPIASPADVGEPAYFGWPQLWPARLWGRRVRPPRGAARARLLGSAPANAHARLAADSGPFFRALALGRLRLPAAIDVPGLVIAGACDAVSSAAATERLARRFGWHYQTFAGRGHVPMLEPDWEEVAAAVHRWIVYTVGADLLALLDETED